MQLFGVETAQMSFTENDVHNQPRKGNYDRVGTKTTEMMLWS